jgi:prepilin-type N-terminal cleavage/methylation domain-containing protein
MKYVLLEDARHESGFTLVELSIVIVIIGLIVAGLVGGQSLVRQAQLRGAISELTGFDVALNAFKLEYEAFPGDMKNATSYWGGATSDGDGNNKLDWDDYITEGYWAWQHLALAKLIPGTFAGVQQGADTIGSAVPKSSLAKSGYGFFWDALASMTWVGPGALAHRHFIRWGELLVSGVGTRIGEPNMTCKEGKAVDEKMDDGRPGLGRMTLNLNNSVACVTTNDISTSEYVYRLCRHMTKV